MFWKLKPDRGLCLDAPSANPAKTVGFPSGARRIPHRAVLAAIAMALVSATIVIAYAALLPRDNLPSFAPAMNTAMKRLVLGKDWATKRMKALRFRLIGLPGRVVRHARKLIIRLGADVEVLSTIVAARQTIRALACGPAG